MNPALYNSSAQYPAPPPYYQSPSHRTHHQGPQTAASPTNRAVPKPRTTFLQKLEGLDRGLKTYVPVITGIFESVITFVFISFVMFLIGMVALLIFCWVVITLFGDGRIEGRW
ncbi:hypothetical protein VF21_06627 [Pseudogymnoascus sp. 05NY08]|nr:hypothetical protein VF21_06627 [Pseudogymnoascus sp. 05NY08]